MRLDDTTPLAELRQASMQHPRRGRVQRVDLVVRRGRVVAVTGPSGAGKSLLLRTVIGLEPVSDGQALLFGSPLAQLDHDGLLALRQRVSYASLSAALLSNSSTRDNLLLPLVFRGFDGELARHVVENMLETFGLVEVAELRPHQYPLRQLVLALLARALILPAELVVLDEPSHELDDTTQVLLMREVQQRARAGAGVLLSLDDPERWREVIDDELRLPAPGDLMVDESEPVAGPRAT